MAAQNSILVNDERDLARHIERAMAEHGVACSLNHLDVSQIRVFDCLFQHSPFVGDISAWDVSRAESMDRMFEGAKFNGDIAHWNLVNLYKAEHMFEGSAFNGNLSRWTGMRMTSAVRMFASHAFHGDLSQWEMPSYCSMRRMVLPEFNGVLPRVQWADNCSCYAVMMGGVEPLNDYLRRTPFSHVHADMFLWDETKCQDWAHPELLRWAHEQMMMGEALGLQGDALRDALLANYNAKEMPFFALPENFAVAPQES